MTVQAKQGWYGVDLDGTLAQYGGWKGETHIGEPIPRMVERIRDLLRDGKEVRIVTARASSRDPEEREVVCKAIRNWCEKHLRARLQITCEKDYQMIKLFDDRAEGVIPNDGRTVDEWWTDQLLCAGIDPLPFLTARELAR